MFHKYNNWGHNPQIINRLTSHRDRTTQASKCLLKKNFKKKIKPSTLEPIYSSIRCETESTSTTTLRIPTEQQSCLLCIARVQSSKTLETSQLRREGERVGTHLSSMAIIDVLCIVRLSCWGVVNLVSTACKEHDWRNKEGKKEDNMYMYCR